MLPVALFKQGLLCYLSKTLLKLINASAGIYEFLLTCIERMALGADFHVHITLNGVSGNGGAAGTSDGSFFVIRMYSSFHFHTSLILINFIAINYNILFFNLQVLLTNFQKLFYRLVFCLNMPRKPLSQPVHNLFFEP